jgi:hypothetical protein
MTSLPRFLCRKPYIQQNRATGQWLVVTHWASPGCPEKVNCDPFDTREEAFAAAGELDWSTPQT